MKININANVKTFADVRRQLSRLRLGLDRLFTQQEAETFKVLAENVALGDEQEWNTGIGPAVGLLIILRPDDSQMFLAQMFGDDLEAVDMQSDEWSTDENTADRMNVYVGTGTVRIQNRLGESHKVKLTLVGEEF